MSIQNLELHKALSYCIKMQSQNCMTAKIDKFIKQNLVRMVLN